jgi:hypothetical protein
MDASENAAIIYNMQHRKIQTSKQAKHESSFFHQHCLPKQLLLPKRSFMMP